MEKTIAQKSIEFTEEEAGMTDNKTRANTNLSGYAIAGLVMLVVGAIVLLPSVLGYWDTLDERKSMLEKAEEMGLGEIPGVNLDETLRFFLIIIIFGAALLLSGIVFVTVAVIYGRKMKEV